MLSSIGLPGLNGFVGEFLILLGSFLTARWWAVVAAAGVILAALYLLWAYQRVFHGEPDEDNATFRELRLREGLVMAPLHRADRVPRRLPEAGPRPDRAVGRRAGRPRRGVTPSERQPAVAERGQGRQGRRRRASPRPTRMPPSEEEGD